MPVIYSMTVFQEAECLVLEVEIEGEEVDLNRVTEVELKMAKLKMEENFEKNRILPGDPEYAYDKQVRQYNGCAPTKMPVDSVHFPPGFFTLLFQLPNYRFLTHTGTRI